MRTVTENMDYTITPSALAKMKAHLTNAYPAEGCGLLAGDDNGSIEEVFFAENNADSQERSGHYMIDPLDLYELEKKVLGSGYRVLGFYHSHPDCDARMSGEDREFMVPQMLYVIASVEDGECGEIRGFVKDW